MNDEDNSSDNFFIICLLLAISFGIAALCSKVDDLREKLATPKSQPTTEQRKDKP